MLVVVEAMFNTVERLSRRVGEDNYVSLLECKVIDHIDGNGFIDEIHIIEIKP